MCMLGGRYRSLYLLVSCIIFWQMSVRGVASETRYKDCGPPNLSAGKAVAFLGLRGKMTQYE
jgi:hypothetical protein